MNELLQSIKSDLTSRRLAPLLALLCVGLVAAFGYAVVGAKGQAKPPTPVAAAPLPSGLPVTVAPPNASAAAAETPAGARYQTKGATRNPFAPLPGAAKPGATGAAAGSGTSNSSTTSAPGAGGSNTTGSNGSSTGAGGRGPSGGSHTSNPPSAPGKSAPAPKKSAPKSPSSLKPRPLPFYSVSALFGLAPAAPGQQPTLTPYEDMLLYEPLPSAKEPLIVFIGVSKTGQQAGFALVVPPILRGPATCAPSQTQCQAILLSAGQSEELEYVKPDGEAVDYELQLVKIARRTGQTGASAKVSAQAHKRAAAGHLALRRAGLVDLAARVTLR